MAKNFWKKLNIVTTKAHLSPTEVTDKSFLTPVKTQNKRKRYDFTLLINRILSTDVRNRGETIIQKSGVEPNLDTFLSYDKLPNRTYDF